MVFLLASQLTGTCQEGNFRHEILVTNVLRRMHKNKIDSLEDYLIFVEDHPKEMPFLLSALTIHTTNWFREKPHYDRFVDIVKDHHKNYPNQEFKMLSAACSTGEEVWSFALMLEDFKQKNPGFKYRVYGRDIDPVSVKKAERCVYNQTGMKDIPVEYHKFLLVGSGKTQGLFTLDKKIRVNCEFTPRSLVDEIQPGDPKFNYIVCRNVLIYFSPEEVDSIVKRLLYSLAPKDSILTVGHSEALDYRKFGIVSLGHSSYAKASEDKSESKPSSLASESVSKFESNASARPVTSAPKKKHRVLVVDDSNTVRAMMSKSIEGPEFETVMAEDAFKADEILKTQSFDIITLDLHMPGKDGHQWLLEKRKEGMETPVIIVSDANPAEAQAVLNVLGDGAQDYIEKKDLREQQQLIKTRLKAIIEHKSNIAKDSLDLSSKDFETNPSKLEVTNPDILVLGASTGGTEALIRTLSNLPPNPPPIVVVQHISVDFAEAFSLRLASAAGIKLAGPEQRTLEPGYLYMSIEDKHIGIKKVGAKLEWELVDSAKVSSHRPSVDYMFDSVAGLKDLSVLAVLLTGMGKDGARGLLNLKNKGALTCCQDAESSVVWGMPGEATKLGAPRFVGSTDKIREIINKALVAPKQKKAA